MAQKHYLDKAGLRELISLISTKFAAEQFVSNDVLTLKPTGTGDPADKNTFTVNIDDATIKKETVSGTTRLKTGLSLGYAAASGNNAARIILKDSNNTELSAVDISTILGAGILSSSSYNNTNGRLTLNFNGGTSVEVDLGALVDYDDVVVAQASQPYMSAALTSVAVQSGGESANNLTLGLTVIDPADATSLSTGLADAYQVKQYVDSQLGNTAISATGDNYITAAVDGTNNKQINVRADVQNLTATAGTPGTYNASTGAQTTAPVNGTLSGTANSLADGADIATKVKTYVDGAIAIEVARSDAKNKADIAALDGDAAVGNLAANSGVTRESIGHALTRVNEIDGVIQAVGTGTDASHQDSFDLAGAANAAYNDALTAVQGYKVNGQSFATNGWTIDGTNIAVKTGAAADEGTWYNLTVQAAIADLYDSIGAGGSVSAQITDAINALNATTAVTGTAGAVSGVTRASYGYALTKVMETNGLLQAVDTSKSEQQAFDLAGAAQAAYVDIAAWTVNGKVLHTLGTDGAADTPLVLNGGDIALTNYSKGSSTAAIAVTDTVNQAIAKLENRIGSIDTTIAGLDGAATVSTGTITTSGVTKTSYGRALTKVSEENGIVQAVASGQSEEAAFDLAGAANAAYTEAVAHKINGQALSGNPVLDGGNIVLTGYTKPESGSAIAATDSVNAAIGKLEAKTDATESSLHRIEETYIDALWNYFTIGGAGNPDPDA